MSPTKHAKSQDNSGKEAKVSDRYLREIFKEGHQQQQQQNPYT